MLLGGARAASEGRRADRLARRRALPLLQRLRPLHAARTWRSAPSCRPTPTSARGSSGVRQMSFTIGILLALRRDPARHERGGCARGRGRAGSGSRRRDRRALILAVTPLGVREPDARAGDARRARPLSRRSATCCRRAPRARLHRRPSSSRPPASARVGDTWRPYIAEYLLRRPDARRAAAGGVRASPGVAAVPLWVLISRRFGARETWMAAMLLAAAAFAGDLVRRAGRPRAAPEAARGGGRRRWGAAACSATRSSPT